MKIKICGLTRPEEANFINDNKVDYAGFVFYPPSKRNVTNDQALEIMNKLSPTVKKVAVMVSPTVEDINNIKDLPFDVYQIHKNLDEAVIEESNVPIWVAVNVSNEEEADKKLGYIDSLKDDNKVKIEAVVVDAPDFGSGKPFNWHKSKRLKKAGSQSPPDRMFILAGGLSTDNVAEGIELFNPDVVDVSSGVEGECGKDEKKIIQFVEAVRNKEKTDE